MQETASSCGCRPSRHAPSCFQTTSVLKSRRFHLEAGNLFTWSSAPVLRPTFLSQSWQLYLVISPSHRLIQPQNPFSSTLRLRAPATLVRAPGVSTRIPAVTCPLRVARASTPPLLYGYKQCF